MAEKLRTVLVGCGGMMGGHANRGYKLLWEAGYRDFEIVACCDVTESSAAKMADGIAQWQDTNPKVYTDLEGLLRDQGDYDAANVVVPHNVHHTVGLPFLEAKKHLIIEKPLAMTMRAGRKLMDAAEANGVVLSVAENYRRAVNHRAMNWVIKSGRLGGLRYVNWLNAHERLWYWNWRDELDIAGGGWTFDGGVHFADLMLYLAGPIKRVTALTRKYNSVRYRDRENSKDEVEATVEDTAMSLLEFENGATGVWIECISAPGDGFGKHIIHGEEGSLDIDSGLKLRGQEEVTSLESLREEYLGQIDEEEKERFFPFGLQESLAQENHEFVEACLRGGPVETDGLEGYKAQAVCLGIYESAALDSQPVELSKVEALEIEEYQAPLNELIGL